MCNTALMMKTAATITGIVVATAGMVWLALPPTLSSDCQIHAEAAQKFAERQKSDAEIARTAGIVTGHARVAEANEKWLRQRQKELDDAKVDFEKSCVKK
jgi:hypothetical protein